MVQDKTAPRTSRMTASALSMNFLIGYQREIALAIRMESFPGKPDVPDPCRTRLPDETKEAWIQLLKAVKTMYAFSRARENAGTAE